MNMLKSNRDDMKKKNEDGKWQVNKTRCEPISLKVKVEMVENIRDLRAFLFFLRQEHPGVHTVFKIKT